MSGNDYLLDDALTQLHRCNGITACQQYYEKLPLSRIWSGNAVMKRRILDESQSFHECLSKLQTLLFVHSQSAAEAEFAVRWNLRQPFALYAPQASTMAPEGTTVRLGEAAYWHDDFRHWGTLERIKRVVGANQLSRVVELGAGTGNLARHFKNAYPRVQYVIIDLPDTLVFSQMFLRAHFPDAKCKFVEGPVSAEELNGLDFVFIPTGLETVLHGADIDAFINTASIGEMQVATVRHWFDFFQNKIDCRYVFSVNRFLNLVTQATAEQWRNGENGHALMFDSSWWIRDWELVPDFLRCPWQNMHARQVLIFAERGEPPPSTVPRLSIQDHESGSWRHTGQMTIHEPPMNCDLTMTGTLFALWEAHRQEPNDASKEALRRYIRYLRNGLEGMVFEDEVHI